MHLTWIGSKRLLNFNDWITISTGTDDEQVLMAISERALLALGFDELH